MAAFTLHRSPRSTCLSFLFCLSCAEPGEPLDGSTEPSSDSEKLAGETSDGHENSTETTTETTSEGSNDASDHSGDPSVTSTSSSANDSLDIPRCGVDLICYDREVCVGDFTGDFCLPAACGVGGLFDDAFPCLDESLACCPGGMLNSSAGVCCRLGCGSRPESCIEEECDANHLVLEVATFKANGDQTDVFISDEVFELRGSITNPCNDELMVSTAGGCLFNEVTLVHPNGASSQLSSECSDSFVDVALPPMGGVIFQAMEISAGDGGTYTARIKFDLLNVDDRSAETKFSVFSPTFPSRPR